MSELSAIIFDLDGVLTDTAELHYRAWKRIAIEEDIPFDRERNRRLRGVPREESLRRLLDGRTISEERFRALLARKNALYVAMIATLSPRDVMPGAMHVVRSLRRSGFRLAIASASRNARQVVDRLGIATWFDAIADGASVAASKPAPNLFLYAAALLNVPPEACAVIEDAAAGLEAARRAAMRTVAFGPDVADEPADAHVRSFTSIDLAHWLGAIRYGVGAAPTVA